MIINFDVTIGEVHGVIFLFIFAVLAPLYTFMIMSAGSRVDIELGLVGSSTNGSEAVCFQQSKDHRRCVKYRRGINH